MHPATLARRLRLIDQAIAIEHAASIRCYDACREDEAAFHSWRVDQLLDQRGDLVEHGDDQ